MTSKPVKRKSWFTPGRSGLRASLTCAAQAPVSPPSPAPAPAVRLDNPKDMSAPGTAAAEHVMVLSHFTKPPHIDFGRLRPGQSSCRTLTVRNPHEYPQDVTVEKFPHKKHFSLDFPSFTVHEECEVEIRIEWRPEDEMCCREMVLLRVNGVYRLQAYLLGRCEEPPKPKRKKIFKSTKAKSSIRNAMKNEPFKHKTTLAASVSENSVLTVNKENSPRKCESARSSPLSPISANVQNVQACTPPMLKRNSTYETNAENRSPLIEKFLHGREMKSPRKSRNGDGDKENSNSENEVEIRRVTVLVTKKPPVQYQEMKVKSKVEEAKPNPKMDSLRLDSMQMDSLEVDLRRETVVLPRKSNSVETEICNQPAVEDSLEIPDIRRETVLIKPAEKVDEEVDIRRETVVLKPAVEMVDVDDVDFRRETVVIRPVRDVEPLDSVDVNDFLTCKPEAPSLPSPFHEQREKRISEAPGSPLEFTFRPVMEGRQNYSSTPTSSTNPSTNYFSAFSTLQAPTIDFSLNRTPTLESRTPTGSMRRARTYTRILDRTPKRSDDFDLSDVARRDSNGSQSSEQFEDSLMMNKTVVTPNSFLKEHRESMGLNATPVTPNSFLRESLNSSSLSVAESASPVSKRASLKAKRESLGLGAVPVTPNSFLKEKLEESRSSLPGDSPDSLRRSTLSHNAVLGQLKNVRESLESRRKSFDMENSSFKKGLESPPFQGFKINFKTPSPDEQANPGGKVDSSTVTKATVAVIECAPSVRLEEIFRAVDEQADLSLPDTPLDELRRLTVVKPSPSVSETDRVRKGKRLFQGAEEVELKFSPFHDEQRVKRRSVFRCQRRRSSVRNSINVLDQSLSGPVSLSSVTDETSSDSMATEFYPIATNGQSMATSQPDSMATSLFYSLPPESESLGTSGSVAMASTDSSDPVATTDSSGPIATTDGETIATSTDPESGPVTDEEETIVRDHGDVAMTAPEVAMVTEQEEIDEEDKENVPPPQEEKPVAMEMRSIAPSVNERQTRTAKPPLAARHEVSTNQSRSRSVDTRPASQSEQASRSRGRHVSERKRRSGEMALPDQKRARGDKRLTRTERLRIEASTKLRQSPNKEKTRRPSGSRPPVAQARLVLTNRTATNAAVPRAPLPFASKNLYYDSAWLEKEERGFTRWINFVLTPQDEEQANNQQHNIEAVSMCMSPKKGQAVERLAPSREQLSLRVYTARRRLNQLRRHACRLFQAPEFVPVVRKLEREIDCGRLVVRSDRNLHADIGLSKRIVDVVMSYNPLWLRVGLETTYGEILPVHGSKDEAGLARFLHSRLVHNPDLAKQYAHPTVPHSYRPGYDSALSAFTLQRLLVLILFLDKAKSARLLSHDPCLFRKEAEFKSSRELLVDVNKHYLRAEGDLVKHLGYLGYHVTHVQTALHEYDYSVTSLATALRDGVRLTRVVEMLSGDWSLHGKLRVPAISRLQKIHNVDTAFHTLVQQGVQLSTLHGAPITSRDVVDGHREKTLAVLWRIIFKYQIEILIDERQLEDEIQFLTRLLRHRTNMAAMTSCSSLNSQEGAEYGMSQEELYQSHKLVLLLRWCQVICAFYHIKVENFTTSFSDGRVLSYIVHHYHPALLPRATIRDVSTTSANQNIRHRDVTGSANHSADLDQSGSGDDSLDPVFGGTFSPATGRPTMYYRLLDNEKDNFRNLLHAVVELGGVPVMLRAADMSNTIPDEKLVITFTLYLCARLLDIRAETRAARVIKSAWRTWRLRRQARSYLLLSQAACCLQRGVRAWLARRRRARRHHAATTVQRAWRAHSARRHHAATTVQRAWRAHSARRQATRLRHARRRQETEKAVILIQTACRGYLARQRLTRHLAARYIQTAWRRYALRQRYLALRHATVTLQSLVRMRKQRSEFVRMRQAAVVLQQRWRAKEAGEKEQDYYRDLKHCTVFVQQRWRFVVYRRRQQRHLAATRIQAWYRGHVQRSRFTELRASTVLVQATFRMRRERRRYQTVRTAALTIQDFWRAFLRSRHARRLAERERNAAILIQATWRQARERRRFLQLKMAASTVQRRIRGRQERRDFLEKKMAAISLQRRVRARKQGGEIRQAFVEKKTAVTKLQSHVRCFLARKAFSEKRQAACKIQATFKAYQARQEFLTKRAAALTIQRFYRAAVVARAEMMGYEIMKANAVIIQKAVRGWLARVRYERQLAALVKLQAFTRMLLARKRFFMLRASALIIQTWYRGVLETRTRVEERRQHVASIVRIQARVRGRKVRIELEKQHSAATKLQAVFRGMVARRDFVREQNAAVTIQRFVRAHNQMKVAREEFMTLRTGIVRLQSVVRMHQARREYLTTLEKIIKIQALVRCQQARQSFLLQRNAATTIQRFVRSYNLARTSRQEFVTVRAGVVRLQALIRMRIARREFVEMREEIIKIQSQVRRNQTRAAYLRQRDAAVSIQRHVRAWRLMTDSREEFLTLRTGIVKLQALVRMRSARKEFLETREKIVRLQACVRMRQVRERFARLRSASVLIQSHVRSFLVGRRQQSEYRAVRGSAVLIQAAYRGYSARSRYRNLRRSAIRIQTFVRMSLARRRYQRRRESALTIQRFFRSFKMSKLCQKDYEQKRVAALRIQSCYRGHLVRKLIRLESSAAVKIQSWYRMNSERRNFQKLRNSALVIQKRFRATLAMREACLMYHVTRGAAMTLQSRVRAILARRRFLRMREAAIRIQNFYRGARCRREYDNVRRKAIVIQRRFRDYLLAKRVRDEYRHKVGKIVIIQSVYRGWKERRKFTATRNDVIRIQALVRARRCRHNYQRLRHSAILIQRQFRAHRLMTSQKATFERERCQVIVAQACVREFLARRNFTKNVSARKIQAFWRGRTQRRSFLAQKNAAVKIQNKFRTWKQRQNFLRIRQATVTIQKFYRSYQCAEEARYEILRQNCAAMAIQTWYKTYKIRRQFLHTRERIVRIQALVRGQLARRRLLEMRDASVLIQRWFRNVQITRRQRSVYLQTRARVVRLQAAWRGYAVRRRVRRCLSAVLLQSWVRMCLTRRRYVRTVWLVTRLQARVRGCLARRRLAETIRREEEEKEEMRRREEAATRIQTCWRDYKEEQVRKEQARRRLAYLAEFSRVARLHLSATRIQWCWRNYRALQQAARHLHSVLTLQHWMRGRLARVRYLRLRQSALAIQRAARDWLRRRHVAARVIQSAARMWLTRRRQERREQAALTIQSAWRGFVSRRQFGTRQIREVRRRLDLANQQATDDKRLANRTSLALQYLLQYRQLSAILEALMHLDAATRLSWRCCERMVEAGAVDILFTLISSCNRSVPHMEIIKLALSVLLNIARYDKTVPAIYRVEGCASSLVDLLSIYLGKGLIFTRTCTLLGVLAQHDRAACGLDDKLTAKLRSVHSVTFRKHKLSEAYRQNAARKSALRSGLLMSKQATPTKRPAQKPFWLLSRSSASQEHDDPLEAVEFLMTACRLGFVKNK